MLCIATLTVLRLSIEPRRRLTEVIEESLPRGAKFLESYPLQRLENGLR